MDDPWGDEEDDGLEYMKRLDAFGEGGFALRDELAKLDAATPPLEGLSDEGVARALTDLVWGLYDLGVLVEYTDHLSDRELYAELLDYCDHLTITFPEDPCSNTHWSPIGGCSEEDLQIAHRYYEDDDERAYWQTKYPEDPMPPKELPPYPRPWIPSAVPRTPRRERIEP